MKLPLRCTLLSLWTPCRGELRVYYVPMLYSRCFLFHWFMGRVQVWVGGGALTPGAERLDSIGRRSQEFMIA